MTGLMFGLDTTLKKHNYDIALRRYEELLTMAQDYLEASDHSLLNILEKLTQLMLEYGQASRATFEQCREAVTRAEEGN